jgi:D-alanyl-D-alanine carboxypeptidase (penicillin-binding protein 5/6)
MRLAVAVIAATAMLGAPGAAWAQKVKPPVEQPDPANKLRTIAPYAFVMDGDTGEELYSWHAHEQMIPASMSKLMLYYIVFEHLRDKRITLDTEFTVSPNAQAVGGTGSGARRRTATVQATNVSTMFLMPNSKVRVEDLLKGAIIVSGNDACIVLGEGLYGSEEAAAAEMTKRAKEIGLEASSFGNVTGLPHDNQRMTARDIAYLSYKIIHDFPEYYKMFSQTEFTWNGTTQPNRNPLLTEMQGVDGVKTGHLEASGFGLVASQLDAEGRRRIIVLNGLKSEGLRASQGKLVMQKAFGDFPTKQLVKKGIEVGHADVALGEQPNVPLLTTQDISATVQFDDWKDVKAIVEYTGPLSAPVKQGDKVGQLVITIPGRKEPIRSELVAGASVNKLNFFALALKGLKGE